MAILDLSGASAPIYAVDGMLLSDALRSAGICLDQPCGGKGTCGKCMVTINGIRKRACQTAVTGNMKVILPDVKSEQILSAGDAASVKPDGTDRYVVAFDVGTTTVVGYLLDGNTGAELAVVSGANPQREYGADVISRLQAAINGQRKALRRCILDTLGRLTKKAAALAGIRAEEITLACVVGNTCMHHLLMDIDPRPLTTPPYMPTVREALEKNAAEILPIAPESMLRILPNIAGFVGADTVACLVATEFDRLQDWTLLIDIGTNGEMVLGRGSQRIACSAAAGPAFEGANIDCGMRGTTGAIDHVTVENGRICCSVIGDGNAVGICGSGLLDAVAALVKLGKIDRRGRYTNRQERVYLTESVYLSQKDIRQVQLAKSAIRCGIELMAGEMGIVPGDIRRVLLAGAFGSCLSPESACAIGMLPPELQDRIVSVGNAAGQGAKQCALSREMFEKSKILACETVFLELATLGAFRDAFVRFLNFEQ